ncbi:helix-turn-helix transcriptional regulator [Gilvimarinus algae]|uniref:WYL domain-containing protein n=1 Tax=Gilvimarinus algae TaxID=3058037 RepID=A0ABT8TGW9_9GAMM|nr:WYL domain-containing protein [Gilvimarinus sp. SDUM040014]MDO3383298.1 WYL domain-containing protein [Gilvimarinus sp. SDUM040014]
MDISEAQRQRLYTFELVAFWEGAANSSLLVKHFGLSRQQASKDIKHYLVLAPQNLTYNTHRKCHQPTPDFKPVFISGSAEQYLAWLAEPLTAEKLPIASLSLPARGVPASFMRAVVQAIRHNQRLEVDYVSLTNPSRQGRVIAPHALVQTGLRWHLRAWCEHKKQFRDFVLSRFRGEAVLSGGATHSAAQDDAWNTSVTVNFAPDPRLTTEKRGVIECDYQMQDGQLKLTTRACLVHYLLQEMRINPKVLDAVPEAQQIVIVNLSDIKEWLF